MALMRARCQRTGDLREYSRCGAGVRECVTCIYLNDVEGGPHPSWSQVRVVAEFDLLDDRGIVTNSNRRLSCCAHCMFSMVLCIFPASGIGSKVLMSKKTCRRHLLSRALAVVVMAVSHLANQDLKTVISGSKD